MSSLVGQLLQEIEIVLHMAIHLVFLLHALALSVQEVASSQEVGAVVLQVLEEVQAHVLLEVGDAHADGGALLREVVLQLPQSLAIVWGPRLGNVLGVQDGLLGLWTLPEDPEKVAVRVRAVAQEVFAEALERCNRGGISALSAFAAVSRCLGRRAAAHRGGMRQRRKQQLGTRGRARKLQWQRAAKQPFNAAYLRASHMNMQQA